MGGVKEQATIIIILIIGVRVELLLHKCQNLSSVEEKQKKEVRVRVRVRDEKQGEERTRSHQNE